ncbi:hypothetical protein AU188_09050 [Mycobacterium sp. IS-3022]|nr:hypothetical protein AU188_09050 [Mycobacterium sp. IS-3022]
MLLVLLLAVWYGVWPPRSLSSYRQQAASTVQSWRSQLDSTRLWVGAVEQGRVTKTAAAVAFREAEADSAATLDRFRSYEPPEPVSEALGLRTRVMAVGQQALSLLGNLRINANAGRWNEVTLAAPAMEDISGALQRLQTELST